jgi:sulfatase modifying factor 1
VPVFDVSWGSAARFSNWLQNGQPTGAQGSGTTETGAYTLNGAISDAALMAITRNAGATYFIPSEDEWYKSAYYKGGGTNAGYWAYATQSNTVPSNVLSALGTNNANYYDGVSYTDPTNKLTSVGAFASSPSAYGTYDQAGDLFQWNEALIGASRGARGGSWDAPSSNMPASLRFDDFPTGQNDDVGFRVASVAEVPEPGSLTLLAVGAIGLLIWARRRHVA